MGRACWGPVRDDIAPDLISRLLFGMVNSLVEWYRPDGALDAESLADAVTEMAFAGLARPAGEGRSAHLDGTAD